MIVPLGENVAPEAGRLLGKARTSAVVDAMRHQAVILTSDLDDILRLATVAGGQVAVAAV